MVSPEQAEGIAKQAIQDYLTACGLKTTEDAGNALMKFISVAGVVMCATVGYDEAVERMYGTAAFIEKNMSGVKFKKEKAN